METIYIVTLRGEHVFHECSLFRSIQDTSEETLKKVRTEIEKKYNLEVSAFELKFGTLYAITSDPKVEIFIEEVYTL